MKKEFILSKIEASQEGAPYVYVGFSDPNDYKPGSDKQQNPFGSNMMAFTRRFDEKFTEDDVKFVLDGRGWYRHQRFAYI